MSKIQAELAKATGIDIKRGEARQDYFTRLMVGVTELNDKAWGSLSEPAQDWFNDAADAKNAKKAALPEMPDFTEVKDEAPARGRRRSADAEDESKSTVYEPAVGDVVNVTNRRGKVYEGKVVEIDDKVIVVDDGKDEVEITRDGATIMPAGDGGDDAGGDDGPYEPKVGDTVTVTNKRGKATTGEIVEITNDVLVVKDDSGDEVEFAQDRIESIELAGAKEEPPTGRRRAAAEPAPAPATGRTRTAAPTAAPADETKPKRSSNPKGVSVGARIRELMAEDNALTEEGVGKVLKKEGLEFRDATLNMIYKDCAQFLSLLKAAKKLK